MNKYKPYPKYKSVGLEWLGEVPAHWNFYPCRKFVDEQTRKNDDGKNENYLSLMANVGVIPYADKGDVGNKKPEDLTKCKLVSKGDFVINSMNYGIGSYGLSDLDGVCSPVYIVLRPKLELVESRFASRIFENHAFQLFCQSFGNGILAHRAAIGWDTLKNMRIGIPPKDEQKCILRCLDYITAKLDDLIAQKQQLIELLKENRQVLINQAVTKGLSPNVKMKDSGVPWFGKIPEHWELKKLKYVCDMQAGEGITSEEIEAVGDFPVYGGNGLRGFSSRFTHEGSFVLIGRQGALCGNINHAEGKFWASEHAVVVTTHNGINVSWLGNVLYAMNLNQYSMASAQPGISVENITPLRVPVPPEPEQLEISKHIKQLTLNIDSVLEKTNSSITYLIEFRQSIITAAVTGKIDLREWKNSMTTDIRERKFEEEIESVLLAYVPLPGASEAPANNYLAYSLDFTPGGYNKRTSVQYDKVRCLIPEDAVGFILASQPKEWEKLKAQCPDNTKEVFLNRLADDVKRNGTIEVLRNGIRLNGCSFKMAFFKPSSGLNPDVINLYRANIFGVLRQWEYSEKNKNSIDLGIFINGLPVFSAELKNPLTGQTYRNAIRQYQFDRNPKEPLFAFGRCLAHFAVDPDEIYLTTRLQGAQTHFLPFNQGRDYGAGNPPTMNGYATEYLWNRIWSRDSLLDLAGNFIQMVEEEDDKGKKTGKRSLLFPRYHQLEGVRSMLRDAQVAGAGKRYLIQHSAGSGKSNTIAWLAHQLTGLHDSTDKRVFDSIVVVTDRRVLDRQLRRTVRQFQQVDGVVEAIDKTSAQLKEALEKGKQVIVTTLQKFGVIVETMGELKGNKFAVLVDEAHSSQSGETSTSLKLVLSAGGLEEAEKEEGAYEEPDEFTAALDKETAKRGWPKNVSFFAFTATPKARTLELFGTKNAQGEFEPFSLYTMRQAIEEGFILDVLQNYITFKSYFRLLKKIEDDPKFEKHRAQYLLKKYVDLSDQAISQKVAISVDHFHQHVESILGGRSKAMIVTRSRLHAVRFKLALDKYLLEQKLPYKALVAFSGKVNDKEVGKEYTEPGMNGFPESETAERFKGQEYRFMVVAEKFQTGFDQPLLCAMYVDKKLGGVGAVQTLSRLNRMVPGKDTFVLDFVNEPDDIRIPFEKHYCKTVLTEATDPNLLYDIQRDLEGFKLYTVAEVDDFNREFLKAADKGKLDQIYALLNPVQERFGKAVKDDQIAFKGKLKDFARLYAFVSQIASFQDTELQKLYNFCRVLWRRLQIEERPLPQDVLAAVDLESYRLKQAHEGAIKLQRGKGELDPAQPKSPTGGVPEEEEPLSAIIRELNDNFGMGLADKDKVVIETLEKQLKHDDALKASADANPPDSFKLSFEAVARERFEELAESHFKFYQRFNDDEQAAAYLMDWLMNRYLKKK